MNVIVGHIASGQAFFSGSILLVLGVYGAAFTSRSRWAATGIALGLILMTVSSTPLGLIYYGLLITSAIGFGGSLRFRERKPELPKRFAYVLCGTAIVGVGLEARFHMLPRVEVDSRARVFIFGDSLTAGIVDGETTWPELFQESTQLEVHDHSRVGARVATMIEIANRQDLDGQVVVLEIGGNDILLGTSVAEFESRLNDLLAQVTQRAKHVVMFELPLPPFFHAFGAAQRKLADQHRVTLIPKHVLMGVLTTGDSTLDSIHLSSDGHRVMAAQVAKIIQPSN